MSENNDNTNTNLDIDPNNVVEYTQSNHIHHKRRHHRRFTKPMLFSWLLLLLFCLCTCIGLFVVKQIPNKTTITVTIALGVVLVITGLLTFRRYHHKGRHRVIAMNCVLSSLFILVGILGVLLLKDVSPLKQQASSMKSDLKTAAEYIKNEDIENARSSITTLNNDISTIQSTLNKPTWTIAQYIPVVGKQVSSVKNVVNAASTASTTIMSPLVDLLETQPLSNLKVDDGFNVNLINSYISFMDGVYPTVKEMNSTLKDTDVSLTGMQDEINEYLTTLDTFTNSYNKYIPAIKAIIGDGSYREYMFMAQNLAEGRCLGGLPGSMTLITVQDGILKIGDFSSHYNYLPSGYIPEYVSRTEQENTIFGGDITHSWDANYIADFSRSSEIYAASYSADNNGQSLNGIISLTPTIISNILTEFETSITLSDGTYVDGSNAMRILAHDLYYKYFGNDEISVGNDIADGLFSETASQAMDIMVSNFSFSNIQKYMNIFSKAIEDNSLLAWMSDETEEKTIINAGFDGNLNNGSSSNITDLYWDFSVANKMGWFIDLNASVSEGTKNSDGTYTYTITATITNIFTQEDYNGAGEYILGTFNGNLDGSLHLFAPNGGTISNISCDNGVELIEDNYMGLQLFYNMNVVIPPQSTMTITYDVTTAPGISEGLVLRKTPTVTDYR